MRRERLLQVDTDNQMMQRFRAILFRSAILLNAWMLAPGNVFATQRHGGMEGLYAHQLAHLFFTGAMALLIFWLRAKRLEANTGWRFIQLAALFFILWNMDAFLVHYLEARPDLIRIFSPNPWRIALETPPGNEWLAFIYYAAKLDHLLSVPAMIFLFLGLRRLYRQSSPSSGESGAP